MKSPTQQQIYFVTNYPRAVVALQNASSYSVQFSSGYLRHTKVLFRHYRHHLFT